MKTGTKAARERGVGEQRADQVRDLEGERERRHRRRWCRSSAAATTSRSEAGDARQAGGHGEDRRVDGRAPGLAVWRRQAARYSTPPPRAVRGFLASWPISRHRSSGTTARCASAPRTASTRPRSRRTSAASQAAVTEGDDEAGRRRAPPPRAADRQGRQARRAAPQQRRPQEVPRRAAAQERGFEVARPRTSTAALREAGSAASRCTGKTWGGLVTLCVHRQPQAPARPSLSMREVRP